MDTNNKKHMGTVLQQIRASWGYYFIAIKIVCYMNLYIFATLQRFPVKSLTLVPASFFSRQSDFGAVEFLCHEYKVHRPIRLEFYVFPGMSSHKHVKIGTFIEESCSYLIGTFIEESYGYLIGTFIEESYSYLIAQIVDSLGGDIAV